VLVGSCACQVHFSLLHSSHVSSGSEPPSIDVYFQRLSADTAIIFPSAPISGKQLRSTPALKQWWSVAKRNAFRTWPYLINSPTGLFLVTKTLKTDRYCHCFGTGIPGQIAQIRIQGPGVNTSPKPDKKFELPKTNTQWVPLQNALEFELEDSGGKGSYTIFIERESTKLFALTEAALKDAAIELWKQVSVTQRC
jgi:hypothetical protein